MYKFRRTAIIAMAIILGGASACDELSNLFEPDVSTETSGGGGGGGGGGVRNPGGSAPSLYTGSNQGEVRHLLSKVSGWKTAANINDGGVPPNVSIGTLCTRDTYVAAAVQYAWAAESYWRLNNSQAASMATEMHRNLLNANSLCSSAVSSGANSCRTLAIWGCPPPSV